MATYQRAFLIYNPKAGKLYRRGHGLLERTVDILTTAGHQITLMPTTGPKMAASLARECLDKGADVILAAGGDGTINEVANGMIGSRVPLGILPGGTANVLSMEIGLGGRMERVAQKLGELSPERIAVGALRLQGAEEPRYFLLMAGVGLDAHIVYNLNAGLKDRLGKFAYWVSGFGMVARMLPEFQTRLADGDVRTSFALASRVRNYGGDLNIARNAHLLANDFEMVLFEGTHAFRYLKYFAGVLVGGVAGMSGVTVTRAKEAAFNGNSDPRIYIQVDGEYAGRLPAKVEIVPDALTLLAPAEYKRLAHG